MRALRRLAWFIVLALVLLAFSLLVGWFFTAKAGAPDIEGTVRSAAEEYGVDPDYLWCVCLAESDGKQTAVGDEGLALGAFQWHEPSWVHVRKAMGLPSWSWLRFDVWESARTAAFAMGRLGLWDWWTTAAKCRR